MLSRLQLVEAVVGILLLVLIPYILKKLLNLWRLDKAFSKLPYDSEGSVFLLGQGPRVRITPFRILGFHLLTYVDVARHGCNPGLGSILDDDREEMEVCPR